MKMVAGTACHGPNCANTHDANGNPINREHIGATVLVQIQPDVLENPELDITGSEAYDGDKPAYTNDSEFLH